MLWTRDEKLAVIREYAESDSNITRVAANHKITPACIYKWMKAFSAGNLRDSYSESRGAKRKRVLRELLDKETTNAT